MNTRWMIERKRTTLDRELLQVVEVYAPSENKEIVKKENKKWSYQRSLVHTKERSK